MTNSRYFIDSIEYSKDAYFAETLTDKEILQEWQRFREEAPGYAKQFWDDLRRRHPECAESTDEELIVWVMTNS